jgi:polyisoprenoid-binding protein YceI
MRMRLFLAMAAALAVIGAVNTTAQTAQTAIWQLDPAHSTAAFEVRHMMMSTVRGEFATLSGTVATTGSDVTTASVNVTIDANSIDTRVAQRDTHLKSADFFDVVKYPTLTFKSKQVARSGAGTLKVTGDLTMHGVTKEVVLEVEGPTPEIKDPWGNIRVGLHATGVLNRKDFGLTWNRALETGGVLVGEEVKVSLDAELVKKP